MDHIKGKTFHNTFLYTILLAAPLFLLTGQCLFATPMPTVAVLPLQSEPGPGAGYLGQATEEILTGRLATLGIKTMDPLIVQKIADNRPVDLSALSSKLGAEYLVSGRIVGTKERLQIFLTLFCPKGTQTTEIHSRPIPEKQMLAEVSSLADRIKLLTESACNTPETDKKLSPPSHQAQVSLRRPLLEPATDLKASHQPQPGGTANAGQPRAQAQQHRDEYDEGDNLLPDLPVEDQVYDSPNPAPRGEKAASAHGDDGGKGWLSWLIPWRGNQVETRQKMTALTSKLPYPPPGETIMQPSRDDEASSYGGNMQDMQHASSDQEQKKSGPENIPPEGPIWQWR